MGTRLYESISGSKRQKKWFINEENLGIRVSGVKITTVSPIQESLRSFNVYAETTPKTPTNSWFEWESSDPSVCTCSRAPTNNIGACVGISEGICTITVRTNDGGFTDSAQVIISADIKSPEPEITNLPITTSSMTVSGLGIGNALITGYFPDGIIQTANAGIFNGVFNFHFSLFGYTPQIGDEIRVTQTHSAAGKSESDPVIITVVAP